MTVAQQPNALVVLSGDAFDEKAKEILTPEDYAALKKYIDGGGLPLALSTASSFFELFLNGNDPKEIHQLNKAFAYETILWARVRYNWDHLKDEYAARLHELVREKVIKAQLESACLLSDMLAVANKKHGAKIKKFLQTGKESDLGGALQIDSIQHMLKVVEGLQKITGQDRTHKISKEETINLNLNGIVSDDSGISVDAAAQVLSIIATDKRKRPEHDKK
jgi:hypothetical protein